MPGQPHRDHWILATELAEAALDPGSVPEEELRPEGWTFVAQTILPQTAAVLLLRRTSPSLVGFFGAGFVRHPRGWELRAEHAGEWPGDDLVRFSDGGTWAFDGAWAGDVYLFVGQAATQVASIRVTIGGQAQALRPRAGSGAFALAGLLVSGTMALEALDAHGAVLARHETRHI